MVTPTRSLPRIIPLAALALLVAVPLSAQKGADRLAFTPCADAARPHLVAGLVEIENVGGPRADAHLDAAVAADPDCPFARALRAFGHSDLTSDERLAALDRAVADAASGEVAELVAILAMRELRRPMTPVRLALTQAAARLTPDEPYFAMLAANQAGGNAAAAEALRAVAERFPDHAATRNLLGYSLQRSGHPAEGLEMIGEYVRLLPSHPNPHDSYAELLQLAGRLDEAERHYRRAIELDAGYHEGHVGLAEVAALRGDHADARRHLEAALARADGPAQRWPRLRALAFNAAVQGNIADVRRYMGESTAEAEKAGNAVAARTNRWNLAFLEAVEGNTAEATRTWAAAREDGNPYAGLGDVYLYAPLGDAARVAAGVKELERTAAANPTVNADAVALGRLMEAAVRGDVATVRRHLQELEGPGYRVIGHAYLARLLRQTGDREGAALAMKEVEDYRAIDMPAAYARRLARP